MAICQAHHVKMSLKESWIVLVSIILAVMTLNNDYIKKNYIKKIISKCQIDEMTDLVP